MMITNAMLDDTGHAEMGIDLRYAEYCLSVYYVMFIIHALILNHEYTYPTSMCVRTLVSIS